MPIPTFAAGATPTAAQLNAALAAAFSLGIDAWTGFTPTVTQGATVTKTITEASYFKVGRQITAKFNLTLTSSGTAANALVVTIPVTASIVGGCVGSFTFQDASTTQLYSGSAILLSTTSLAFVTTGTGLFGATGSSFALAVANTDTFAATVVYQSAT